MAQGVRFECQRGCTECCRQRGFVYLTEDDMVRAAAFLGITPEAFERKYVYRTRRLLRLRVPRPSRSPASGEVALVEGGLSPAVGDTAGSRLLRPNPQRRIQLGLIHYRSTFRDRINLANVADGRRGVAVDQNQVGNLAGRKCSRVRCRVL